MAINKVNNKKYIGQTVGTLEKRKNQHEKGYASYMSIAKAIQKYGKDSFDWHILQEYMDTGEVFSNATKAAESINGNKSSILNSIKNKTTAYGFHWNYYNYDNTVPSLI